LNAKAFTIGRDVFLGKGEYAPESIMGRKLLAHELTHAIQQTGFYSDGSAMVIQRVAADSESDSDLESELFRGDPLLEAVHDGLDLISKTYHSRGEPVRKLQLGLLRLNPLALPVYGADGIFGSETEAAVKEFQGNSGLDTDGMIGKLTLGLLDDRLAVSPIWESSPGLGAAVSPVIDNPYDRRDCGPCECGCTDICPIVARKYAEKHVIWLLTRTGYADPKKLKVFAPSCYHHSHSYPCTWVCRVPCQYENENFEVIVQLANSQRFYAIAPSPLNTYPICTYSFYCPCELATNIWLYRIGCQDLGR
jgi:peptidoglycan hydrolase-like protein with peptidoglycan-binding domain